MYLPLLLTPAPPRPLLGCASCRGRVYWLDVNLIGTSSDYGTPHLSSSPLNPELYLRVIIASDWRVDCSLLHGAEEGVEA